jgi:hypothetical protein
MIGSLILPLECDETMLLRPLPCVAGDGSTPEARCCVRRWSILASFPDVLIWLSEAALAVRYRGSGSIDRVIEGSFL